VKRSVVIALIGALGCEDPLVDPATVIGPRVVGARVRAADDAASAEPRAGQGASIDWLVISNEAGTLAATAAFCAAEPSSLGAPRCSAAAFDERSVELRIGEPLTLDFTLPAALGPGSPWLAWLGSCNNSSSSNGAPAAFDATGSGFSCADGSALSAFYRGRAATDAPNNNPVLADDEISIGGEPWLSADPVEPGTACADLPLPSVSPDQQIQIGFELGVDDRESLPDSPGQYAAHDRESLVYTHLATLSGLDRAFSALDFDSDATGFAVPFNIAADVEARAEGETINFFLLVRDERGGVDWLRRDACLVPSASGGP
jgi:hypothetical protein